jgi:hypothetical protein
MIDWGLGHYEQTASELEPVAEHVVSLPGYDRVNEWWIWRPAPATPPYWRPAWALS